jgi:hypothetical protein
LEALLVYVQTNATAPASEGSFMQYDSIATTEIVQDIVWTDASSLNDVRDTRWRAWHKR